MKKKILVTGAASGIGAAITKQLTSEGHFVYACDIDHCETNESQRYYKLDVTNSVNIHEIVDKISQVQDSLDGLVNCAGIAKAGPLMEIDMQEMKDIFAVNVFFVISYPLA